MPLKLCGAWRIGIGNHWGRVQLFQCCHAICHAGTCWARQSDKEIVVLTGATESKCKTAASQKKRAKQGHEVKALVNHWQIANVIVRYNRQNGQRDWMTSKYKYIYFSVCCARPINIPLATEGQCPQEGTSKHMEQIFRKWSSTYTSVVLQNDWLDRCTRQKGTGLEWKQSTAIGTSTCSFATHQPQTFNAP